MLNRLRGISVALALHFLFLQVYGIPSALGLETFDSRPGIFHIRQESLQQGGVLVSRPHTADEEILNFLRANGITSIDDYSRWLNSNIRYTKSPGQYAWNSPLETLKKRQGDCKDFAILNSAVLQVLGYRPHFVALVGPAYSHAICVFEKDGAMLWFDNAKMVATRAADVEALARQLVEQYGYKASLELNLANQQWRMLYQKS